MVSLFPHPARDRAMITHKKTVNSFLMIITSLAVYCIINQQASQTESRPAFCVLLNSSVRK